MNQYKLYITSQDYYGVNFIESIVKYSGKGAVLDMTNHIYNSYPFSCTMLIETEEFLKSELCIEVTVIKENWTKEDLDNLDWDEFKRITSRLGISGRQRETMSNLFLKAQEEVVVE